MKDPHRHPYMTSIRRDPWCLVYRGGQAEGRRPNTRIAYLKSAVPGPDGAYMAYLMNHNCKGWTKSLRLVSEADIAERFRGWHQPAPAEIRKAIDAIPKTKRSEAS